MNPLPSESIPTNFELLCTAIGASNRLVGDVFGDKITYTTETGTHTQAELVLIEDDDDPNHAIFECVTTPEQLRGQGEATRAIKRLLVAADSHGMDVSLCIDPQAATRGRETPPLNADQLRDWYRKLGFVFHGGNDSGLRMSPQSIVRFKTETIEYDPVKHGSTIELAAEQNYSDPETIRNVFTQTPKLFQEGKVYDAGGVAYGLENGELKRFRGVELDYDFTTGLHIFTHFEDYAHGSNDPIPSENSGISI